MSKKWAGRDRLKSLSTHNTAWQKSFLSVFSLAAEILQDHRRGTGRKKWDDILHFWPRPKPLSLTVMWISQPSCKLATISLIQGRSPMIITEIQIQFILLGNYSRMRYELEASLQRCRAKGSSWSCSPSPAPWRQGPATFFKAETQGAPPYRSSSSLVGLVWRNPTAEAGGTLLVLDFLSCVLWSTF